MLKWRNQNNIALDDDDIDNCEHKKHFTSTHGLMQHLESNNGYLHFATKMYLTTLHQIENKSSRGKKRSRKGQDWNPPNIKPRAGMSRKQQHPVHPPYYPRQQREKPHPRYFDKELFDSSDDETKKA